MGTMKAAVVTEFGKDLNVSDSTDIPTPGPHEALVKLISTGVCHTDLHAAHGDWPIKPSPPFVPGHEGVGRVEAIGDDVTSVKVGDIVGSAWLWSACGDCEFCRTGWETLCEKQQNGGYSVDGSFGEYMLVDARYACGRWCWNRDRCAGTVTRSSSQPVGTGDRLEATPLTPSTQ